jgi:RNA polymerase sigma-70 factor (ECF subfamily)
VAEPSPRDLEEESRLVHEELARLPVVERDVLALFYLQELSLDELSQVLDIPVGTVKSRLFRARRLLRARLVEKGFGS